MNSPSMEKSVSPKLANNNPTQMMSTTETMLIVITSNLKTTAHSRILAGSKPEEIG